MDAVLKSSHYSRPGQADPEHRRLELESNGSFLFGIVPDDDFGLWPLGVPPASY